MRIPVQYLGQAVASKEEAAKAEAKEPENKGQEFTKPLSDAMTCIGQILTANDLPKEDKAATKMKQEGYQSLESYSAKAFDPLKEAAYQCKEQIQEMIERFTNQWINEKLEMEVANQLAMFNDKPKRRMYKDPKPKFGTNNSLQLNETVIHKAIKNHYYHSKQDCSLSILSVIRIHSYLVTELGVTENNWIGIFKRFCKKENSRLAVLLMTAEKLRVPLMDFYKRILLEFDGDYDEVQ